MSKLIVLKGKAAKVKLNLTRKEKVGIVLVVGAGFAASWFKVMPIIIVGGILGLAGFLRVVYRILRGDNQE